MTFYKTLFARMGNVKAGVFVDGETGESLNDVEKVLGKLGISLRDYNGEFRNFGHVLDDVGNRWESFNSVQQKAIATALAGARNQEKLNVLFQNYGDALSYAETAANSAGTAQSKYDDAYLDSIESRMNALKAAWEGFSMGMLKGDFVKMMLSPLIKVAEALAWISSLGGGVITATATIGVAFLAGKKILDKFGLSVEEYKKRVEDKIATTQEEILKNSEAMTSEQALAQAKKECAGATEEEIQAKQQEILKNNEARRSEEALAQAKKQHAEESKRAKQAMMAYVAATIALAVAVGLMNDKSDRTKQRIAAIISGVIALTAAIVIAIKVIKGGIQSFMASNPFGWIMLAISGLVTMITAVTNASKAAGVKAREHADAMKEEAEAAKQTAKELKSLIDEYKRLGDELDDGETFSAESVKRIAEIQSEIVDLLGYQAYGIDLANGKYESQIRLLRQIQAQNAKVVADEAKKSLSAEESVLRVDNKGSADIFVRGDSRHSLPDNPFKNIAGLSIGSNEYASGAGGKINLRAKVGLDDDKSIQQQLEGVKEALSIFDEQGLDKNSNFYKWLTKTKQELEENIKSLSPYITDVLNLATEQIALENYDIWDNLSKETYNLGTLLPEYNKREKAIYVTAFEERRQYLIGELRKDQAIIDAFSDEEEMLKYVTGSIDNWLMQNQSQEWADYQSALNPVRAYAESYTQMLDEWQGGFDALNSALESFIKNGIVAPSEMKKLMEELPNFEEYFVLGDKGYELIDTFENTEDALQHYIDNAINEYQEILADIRADIQNFQGDNEKLVAALEQEEITIDNINQLYAVFSSMLNSTEIQKATDALNEQKDALGEQLNNYKSLIDIRKDLLKTYKQEIDYQKQLAQKQKAVVDLETQLALARLDTSAAGRAKVRELESQLETAKDDFADFNLEHAVDVLAQQMDDEYKEYSNLIQTEVDRIVEAIKDLPHTTEAKMQSKVEEVDNSEELKKLYEEQLNALKASHEEQSAKEKELRDDVGDASKAIETEKAKGTEGKNDDWVGDVVGAEAKYDAAKEAYDAFDQAYLNSLTAQIAELEEKLRNITEQHHTGGIVGTSIKGSGKSSSTGLSLKPNEVFAKLLKGEGVLTETQITNLITKTMPTLAISGAKFASGSGGEITLNTTFNCGSITKESLPDVKKIVNAAVDEIKAELSSGLSRGAQRANANSFMRKAEQ